MKIGTVQRKLMGILNEGTTKKIISWDFDGTLFDQATERLYAETSELYNRQEKSGEYIVLVCTYRSKSDSREIKNHLHLPTVVCTDGEDKLQVLLDKFPFLEVEAHYDDDVYAVNDFASCGIDAYFVYDPDEDGIEKKLKALDPRVKLMEIDKTKLA